MRLLVVRHGETLTNRERRFTGQHDVPLSRLGEAQARALGASLADERFDALISSDLQRTQATLAPLAALLGQSIRLDPALREIGVGIWEGLTGIEVRERYPGAIERWESSTTYAPDGGESVGAFQQRIVGAFERTRQEYPDGSVLWMTHGGALDVLLCHILGMDLTRRWQFRTSNTGIFEFDVGADYCIVMRANDTGHLRGLHIEQDDSDGDLVNTTDGDGDQAQAV